MHSDPLVSIIIPTYNYGKYVSKAITSCVQQTHRNIEIIVVDDGSTDSTQELVASFADPRIRYQYQMNQGVSAARNNGLEAARGEFIAFLDADDWLTDDSVEVRLDALRRFPEVGFVFTDAHSCNEKGVTSHKDRKTESRVSARFWEDLLLRRLDFQTCSVLMTSHVARLFPFPLHLSNGEDLVYFSRVFFAAKGYYLARPTAVVLHHGDSLRHDAKEVMRQDMAFVETILDDPFYGGALEYLRKDLTANRHLELFRRLYLSGEMELARSHYLRALSVKPTCLFRTRYLSKAIKSFF